MPLSTEILYMTSTVHDVEPPQNTPLVRPDKNANHERLSEENVQSIGMLPFFLYQSNIVPQ